MDITTLIANIPEASAERTGKFESMLDDETRGILASFVEHLVTEGKTTATAQSYKSYVAKALALELDWADMSSDVRSAVKAFAKFAA